MFNSKECEWSDLSLFIDGVKITGFRGLKYSVKPDKESLYAGGDEPIGIQSGNRQYAGEIKLLKGQFDELNTAAKAAGYRDINDLDVNIVACYAQKGLRVLHTDTLLGVQFDGYEKGMEQGAKYMEITIPILFLRIKEA